MLSIGSFLVWLPQIISFIALLVSIAMIFKAWKIKRSPGFLLLLAALLLGELLYLGSKFGLLPQFVSIVNLAVFHYWMGAILGVVTAAAWWLIARDLTPRLEPLNRK